MNDVQIFDMVQVIPGNEPFGAGLQQLLIDVIKRDNLGEDDAQKIVDYAKTKYYAKLKEHLSACGV